MLGTGAPAPAGTRAARRPEASPCARRQVERSAPGVADHACVRAPTSASGGALSRPARGAPGGAPGRRWLLSRARRPDAGGSASFGSCVRSAHGAFRERRYPRRAGRRRRVGRCTSEGRAERRVAHGRDAAVVRDVEEPSRAARGTTKRTGCGASPRARRAVAGVDAAAQARGPRFDRPTPRARPRVTHAARPYIQPGPAKTQGRRTPADRRDPRARAAGAPL